VRIDREHANGGRVGTNQNTGTASTAFSFWRGLCS